MTTTKSAPTTDQQHAQIVSALCQDLGEQLFTGPHRQISLIVQIVGGPAAQELAQRALTAHNDGMLTNDKSKKRTPGGCFFALFKAECTPEQLAQFYQQRRAGHLRKPDKVAPKATDTKPTTTPTVAPSKPAPSAQPPQAKKPVVAARAGQAGQSGKRKPIAPAVNHRKSGKCREVPKD